MKTHLSLIALAFVFSACASPTKNSEPRYYGEEPIHCPGTKAYACYQPQETNKAAERTEVFASRFAKLGFLNETATDLQITFLDVDAGAGNAMTLRQGTYTTSGFDKNLRTQPALRARILTATGDDFGAIRIGVNSDSKAFCEATVPSGYRLVACNVHEGAQDSFEVFIHVYKK